MVIKIKLKDKTTDKQFTEIINTCENDKVFLCAYGDTKELLLKFENSTDCLAWLLAKGILQSDELEKL